MWARLGQAETCQGPLLIGWNVEMDLLFGLKMELGSLDLFCGQTAILKDKELCSLLLIPPSYHPQTGYRVEGWEMTSSEGWHVCSPGLCVLLVTITARVQQPVRCQISKLLCCLVACKPSWSSQRTTTFASQLIAILDVKTGKHAD